MHKWPPTLWQHSRHCSNKWSSWHWQSMQKQMLHHHVLDSTITSYHSNSVYLCHHSSRYNNKCTSHLPTITKEQGQEETIAEDVDTFTVVADKVAEGQSSRPLCGLTKGMCISHKWPNSGTIHTKLPSQYQQVL